MGCGLVAASLVACGGGGDSTPPAPVGLAGAFHVMAFSGTATPAAFPRSAWGGGTGDGSGPFTVTVTANSTGDPNPPTGLPPVTYDSAVDAQGLVRLSINGAVWYEGGLSDDGHVAVLSSVLSLSDPGILVLVRHASGAGPGTLQGNYWSGGFGTSFGILSTFALDNVNGAGGIASLVGGNLSGVISPPGAETLTYTVDASGASTLLSTTFANTGWIGGVSADGDFAGWGGNTFPPPALTLPSVRFSVRGAAGTSTATFAGTYHFAAIEYNLLLAAFVSSSGLATTDGMGNVNLTGTVNTSGAVASGVTSDMMVSVDANGFMTGDRTGILEGLGGTISPNGRYAILSGGGLMNSSPILFLFVRQ